MDYNYYLRNDDLVYIGDSLIISNAQIEKAAKDANEALCSVHNQINQFGINIFEILGMRNLSGFVGECFAKCLAKESNDNLQSNLHQDGYPDLVLTNTKERKDYFESLYYEHNGRKYPVDKSSFSPFKYGGVEVKACCGTTPPAKKVAKPLIGEQRIGLIQSFDWKAHHRETNNLIGILWDFINSIPVITAVFYSNNLEIEDWGKIVHPKNGGGRTTSVSIMNKSGIQKMCKNWIAVIDDTKYIQALSAKKWIGYEVNQDFLNEE